MVQEFTINDIYDWDDSIVDEYNNKLFRMTSLLQIIAKSLPCFEHLLKKDKKMELIRVIIYASKQDIYVLVQFY